MPHARGVIGHHRHYSQWRCGAAGRGCVDGPHALPLYQGRGLVWADQYRSKVAGRGQMQSIKRGLQHRYCTVATILGPSKRRT